MAERIYYFAYGSNMSHARLARRVAGSRMLGCARLERHRLCFHKASKDGSAKCDAFYTGNRAHFILGVVFSIPATQRDLLDRFEGLGHGYERKESIFHLARGSCRAFLYYATAIDPQLRPYHWYKHHVIRGAELAGLPASYQEMLNAVVSIPDPDTARMAREYAVYL